MRRKRFIADVTIERPTHHGALRNSRGMPAGLDGNPDPICDSDALRSDRRCCRHHRLGSIAEAILLVEVALRHGEWFDLIEDSGESITLDLEFVATL